SAFHSHVLIKRFRLRAVGRAEPIGDAVVIRIDESALRAWHRIGIRYGLPFLVEAFRPRLACERLGVKVLAGDAIEDVEEPVAICKQQKLARSTVEVSVDQ